MMRELLSAVMVVAVAVLVAVWLSAESRAQTKASLAGTWTLNTGLTERPRQGDARTGDTDQRRRGGAGRGGGFGRGRGAGRARGSDPDRDAMARRRDAMRDIVEPSERLTITQAETMIVITTAEGRTTRLSPDGQTITDDNTKVDRKTRWDGERLVSEISGAVPGKITQTYIVDPQQHQLRVMVSFNGGRGGRARTVTHVYDALKN
jgi:hypothetical protein